VTDTDEKIIRIAAKGDGITPSGRYAWGAAPGDTLRADGTLEPAPRDAALPALRSVRGLPVAAA
jgi:23S rRNA (uracil1939-C5)-methyltransferase